MMHFLEQSDGMFVAYIIASIVFVLVIAMWLRAELQAKTRPLLSGWPWLATATIAQLAASVLAVVFDPMGFGNILLHAVGGGVMSALLFFYLLHVFNPRINWRVQFIILLCFTAVLGVLNELAEFALELLRLGIFSYDTQDTWRDLVSNTCGAAAAWVIVCTGIFAFRSTGSSVKRTVK